jgi:hypothetical protein
MPDRGEKDRLSRRRSDDVMVRLREPSTYECKAGGKDQSHKKSRASAA